MTIYHDIVIDVTTHRNIVENYEISLVIAAEEAARAHLAAMRAALAPYNLSRHTLAVDRYLGFPGLLIDGEAVWARRIGDTKHPLYYLLHELSEQVAHAPWAHYMIGETL